LRGKTTRFLLTIPALAYILWYVWMLVTNVVPVLQAPIQELFKFSIWQIAVTVLAFTLFLVCAVLAIMWIAIVWTVE
jgi:hypothetical protein